MAYESCRTTLTLPGRGAVHVVGTCHLSRSSAQQLVHAINAFSPAAVCLELCGERTAVLDYTNRPPPLPALTWSYARENWRVLVDPLFWVTLPLLGVEALVGSPEGYEFTAAAKAARTKGAQVLFIDRPVSITRARIAVGLKQLTLREWGNILLAGGVGETAEDSREVIRLLGIFPWPILSSLARIGRSGSTAGSVEQLAVEKLRRARILTRRIIDNIDPHTMGLDQIPRGVRVPLLEERDVVLGHSLFHIAQRLPPDKCAVAVVGAGHVPGIKRLFCEYTAAASCSATHCAMNAEIQELYTKPDITPLLLSVAGTALGLSAISLGGRLLFMRWLRRTQGGRLAHWGRRINYGALLLGTTSLAVSTHTLGQTYATVRGLQLRCAELLPPDVEDVHS